MEGVLGLLLFAGALHVKVSDLRSVWVPVLLMAILFGLAMDYELFLVSGMRESYVHQVAGRHLTPREENRIARDSVVRGFAGAARVVTAAALIMFFVFAAFVPEGSDVIKVIALGLAVNATIGEGAFIDPDVTVGYRYHPECGDARIGKHCILHKGTVIYGDVTLGDHFHAAHYVVVRAFVKMGDYCTVMNHSAIEGIVRFGKGVRIMSNAYIPSRTWFGDNVFVGRGVNFLNDRYPGRREGPPSKTM